MKKHLAISILMITSYAYAFDMKAVQCLIYKTHAKSELIYANNRGIFRFQNGETAHVSVTETADKLIIRADVTDLFDRYIDRDSGEIYRKHWISLKDNTFEWIAMGVCKS